MSPTTERAIDRRSRPRSPLSRSNHRPRHDAPARKRRPDDDDHHSYPRHRPHHRYSHSHSSAHADRRPEKRPRHDRSPEPAHARHHDRQQPHDPHNDRQQPPAAEPRSQQVADEEPEAVADQASLIQERHKRREALRAKHRGQNAPLLHQALHVATPSDSTSVVASPSASLPSSPASPASFSVANDQDLANPVHANPASPAANQSPAAADYDPAMDMQEDKLRKTHLSASMYDETTDKDPDPPALPRKSNDIDMFAEDDDDDMFASGPSNTHDKDDATSAAHHPEAKQLDRSLLDDWDDPEGYYRIILGELLDGRYHVQTNLGKGVFSAVVRALDTTSNRTVAIKIIRTQESM